jgi:hypothetical protein
MFKVPASDAFVADEWPDLVCAVYDESLQSSWLLRERLPSLLIVSS